MVNIYYCTTNEKLFTQMLVSIVSLVNHTEEVLNVINLTVEVPEFNSKGKKTNEKQVALINKILKDKNPASSFKSVDVSDLFRERLLKGPNIHNKFYSYYIVVRLLAHLVNEIPDKVLYLDCDVIFNGDVKELFDIDVDGYDFAGRKDVGRLTKYLQSGVMLLNMKEIRQDGSFERACDLVTTHKYFAYIDMTALNTACKKKKVISKRYNSYKYTKDCIVHHVCATRESRVPFTKKWKHRIKTDEIALMRKYEPQYNELYDDVERLLLELESNTNE